MDDQRFGFCEVCETPINEGDRYFASSDDCYLCETHAPALSEAISQHEEILSTVPWRPGDLPYETRDEMKASLSVMRAEFLASGDRKLLTAGG